MAKLIVLTGATRGLGRAMTEGFIAAGHTVLGCGSNSDKVAQLQERYPEPHRWSVVDVSDPQRVNAWAEELLAEFPAPDLLINNAATINRNAPLWEVPQAEFSRLVDINLKGVFHVTQAFVPAMIARGSGVIVNFSSTWGRSTSAEVAPYCASKFAIEGLTQALAQELPSGMAAIPLNPGVINTEMLQSCFGSGAASFPSPEQWAQQAVPMILGFGPQHNGQSLTVR